MKVSMLNGKRGQLTIINFIFLVITIMVVIYMFPILANVISYFTTTVLVNDGLPTYINSILSALVLFIPILILILVIVTGLLYSSPTYTQPPQ